MHAFLILGSLCLFKCICWTLAALDRGKDAGMDDHDESSREWLEHILLFVTCGQVDRENILWWAHCKEGKHSLPAESGHGFWNVSDACFKITKEPNKSRNGQPAHWDKHGTQPSPVRASPWKKIAFYHIAYSRVNDIIYHSSLPWCVVTLVGSGLACFIPRIRGRISPSVLPSNMLCLPSQAVVLAVPPPL